MNWENCFTNQRLGQHSRSKDNRSDYQRDYDRLIFSSPFRRLQNKTQVFPLPGSVFVHNRLTHSLEVSSVGRSLATMVGNRLAEKYANTFSDEVAEFYKFHLANVVSAACLAHDIGNPAFGHSGEEAISAYFIDHENSFIDDVPLRGFFNEKEWSDLIQFEGNANAIRLLTADLHGRLDGGMRLTATTLAAIAKYPCESIGRDRSILHRKKYGFFQADKEKFKEIATLTNMIPDETSFLGYKRHPFVFLVEAADDICYRLIDLEDAHRLKIISTEWLTDTLSRFVKTGGLEMDFERFEKTLHSIQDVNERSAYLRSKCIAILLHYCTEIFIQNDDKLINGTLEKPLLDLLPEPLLVLSNEIENVSIHKIYNHSSVVEVEVAGFHVMSGILEMLVPALLRKTPNAKEDKILRIIPEQFEHVHRLSSPYQKVMIALDYVSGMTDLFATELYRKLTGIEIGRHA